MDWKEPYLIQRLNKPHNGKLAHAFAFGGGYTNGGFSNEAMEMLRQVFKFDYMGSAEFEFGAVPKAFSKIFQQNKAGEMCVWTIKINYTDVYVFSHIEHKAQIKLFLADLAKGWKSKCYLKEYPQFAESIKDSERCTKGWIDIKNCFMFFICKEMFEKTCKLFGIEQPENTP